MPPSPRRSPRRRTRSRTCTAHRSTSWSPATGRSTDGGQALVRAVRESLLNAVRHGQPPVSVYLEIGPAGVEAFVRDHGPGFEVEEIPTDRLGVRQSILGRMERHGGAARVRRLEQGTEVSVLPAGAARPHADHRTPTPSGGLPCNAREPRVDVVLVDDHRMFRSGVRAEHRRRRCTIVGEAPDVDAAIAVIRPDTARRGAARRAPARRHRQRRRRRDPRLPRSGDRERPARALPRAVGLGCRGGRDRGDPRRGARLRHQDDQCERPHLGDPAGGRRRRCLLASARRLRARRVRCGSRRDRRGRRGARPALAPASAR